RDDLVTGVQTCALPILAIGTLHLAAPPHWRADVAQPALRLRNVHSQQSSQVAVSGDSSAEGTYELRASLDAGGRTYNEGFTEIRSEERRVGKGWSCRRG